MNDLDDLAERIRDARVDMRMTQAELAARCGVRTQTISRVENGKIAHVAMGTIAKILDALGYRVRLDRVIFYRVDPEDPARDDYVREVLNSRYYGGRL